VNMSGYIGERIFHFPRREMLWWETAVIIIHSSKACQIS
jgi:hypothetical protein